MSDIARQRLRTFRHWAMAQVRVRLPGHDRDRGAILILCALVLAVLVVAVAVTVDFGRLTTTKRDLHTIADQAAFDGYRALSDPAYASSPIFSTVADRAADSANRNGFPANNGATYPVSGGRNTLKVELGVFSTLDAPPYPSTTSVPTTLPPSTSTTVPTAGTFTPLNPSDCPPRYPIPGTTTRVPGTCSDAEQETANAVRVTATTDVKWFFVPGSQTAVAQAVAGGNGFTGIQVGSFAARVRAGCAPTATPPPTTTTTPASTTTTGLLGLGTRPAGPSVVAAGGALTPAQVPTSLLPTSTTTTTGPTTTTTSTTLLPSLTTTTAPTTTAAPTTTTTLVPPPPAVDPCTALGNVLFGVNLTAAAYQGLASSSVTLQQLATALNVASPQQLLSTSLTAGQVANATATALDNQGNTSAGASSATIAAAEGTIPPPPSPSSTTTTTPPSTTTTTPPSTTTTSIVSVSTTVTTTVGGTTPTTSVPTPTTSSTVAPIGPNGTAPLPGSVPFDQVTGEYGGSVGTGSTAEGSTHFDALDLLVGSFMAEFGNNQSSISVPGFKLGLTLPGVGAITAYTNFSIIEPPRAGYGPRCPAVPSPPAEGYTGCANTHSAQLVAAVTLAVPVTTAIGTLTLAIPLVVQAGHGQAWVTNIPCRSPNDGQAEVDFLAHTDAADVSLGTVNNLSNNALSTLQPLLDVITGTVGSAGFPGLPLPAGGTPPIPSTPPAVGSPISLPVGSVNQSIGTYDTPNPPGANFAAGTPFNPNRGPVTVGVTSANVPAGVAYNVDNALQMIAATAGPQITATPVAGLSTGVLTTLQSAFDSVLPQIGPYLLDPLDSFLRVGIGGADVVNLPVPPGPTPTQGTNCNAPQVVQ